MGMSGNTGISLETISSNHNNYLLWSKKIKNRSRLHSTSIHFDSFSIMYCFHRLQSLYCVNGVSALDDFSTQLMQSRERKKKKSIIVDEPKETHRFYFRYCVKFFSRLLSAFRPFVELSLLQLACTHCASKFTIQISSKSE